ncbi:hypothetical protein PVIIG_06109 [Plasmodium vivax India VII]|uniref:CYIR protein n=1 Tax=Plasmodium vivax India VII TaxID=1077284 RepID=A0A0J9V8N6_PLAVI|nr:hypothetical protein PVIIG_06109 [Plasmodium vivax India VII]
MGEFLGKSKLDSLRTVINYNYFGRYPNNCAKYPNITSRKYLLGGKFWGENISDKLINALCYVYKKKEDNALDENLCNYLYYCLGSKVLTNLRHTDFFYDVLHKIYYILSNGEHGKVCNPVNYSIYEHNFHKFKLVYDLSEDYETYKLHFVNPNPSCDIDYDDAIKSYKFLHNKLLNECSMKKTYYNTEYCNVFNNYFTKDKNDQISSWTCHLPKTEELGQQLEKEHRKDAAKENIHKNLQ